MTQRVVIVGGGISGLAAAWHVRQHTGSEELEILVLEKDSRPGGTAWTERRDGFLLELGPNGFLDNKTSTLELCTGLGLQDRLVQAEPAAARRFVLKNGRLRQLPTSPGQFLRSDLLSWRGKLRVLAERFIPPRRQQSEETVYDFGCRRIGREATETLLDAFVTGILAGDYKLLSLPACFPRMVELEQKYGGLLKAQIRLAKERRAQQSAQQKSSGSRAAGAPAGTLTAPRGGMGTLVDALAQALAPALRLGVAVERIEKTSTGWLVHADGSTIACDAVTLAAPSYAQAHMLEIVDPVLSDELAAIPYTTAIVAVVGYRRGDLAGVDTNGFGYLAPQSQGRPVLGVLWSSSIFPEQSPPDCFQFRAILGGWRRRDVLEWPDKQVLAAVREDLRMSLGVAADPCFTWIHRWPRAIPQYHIGHLDRLGRIEELRERHAGLFLAGNAFRGVSLNDCTADALRVADEVVRFLAGRALKSARAGDTIDAPAQ